MLQRKRSSNRLVFMCSSVFNFRLVGDDVYIAAFSFGLMDITLEVISLFRYPARSGIESRSALESHPL